MSSLCDFDLLTLYVEEPFLWLDEYFAKVVNDIDIDAERMILVARGLILPELIA